MTKENLKEYLGIKEELKQITYKLKELEERKTSIKSKIITDMPINFNGYMNNNSIDDLLIKIEECIEEYRKKEILLYNKQLEIEKAINILKANERVIMRMRYIEGYKWDEISIITNYSEENIYKIHRNSLKKIT